MKLNILAFGLAREVVGMQSVELIIDSTAITVSELKDLLLSKYPKLVQQGGFMIAINTEYASDNTAVKDGDEIAIIPPTSGG